MEPKEMKGLIDEWYKEAEKHLENGLMVEVLKKREEIKNDTSPTVWLGGPGQTHELYKLRKAIGGVLKKMNFEVKYSEDYKLGVDLASKEAMEAETLDIIIILAISEGSSAEAIHFAHYSTIRPKLQVYIPRKYRYGFVFKTLERWGLITNDSLFSLDKFIEHTPDLVKKVVSKAEIERWNIYRKKQMPREPQDMFQSS